MKFCQHCGEKRVANARYCVGCGETLAAESGPIIQTVGAVVIVSLILFAVVRFGVLEKKPGVPVAVDEHAGHNHAPGEGHDSAAETDDPKLKMLMAHAESGSPAALLDLAEYQAQLGHQDSAFLMKAAQTMDRFVLSFPNHGYGLRLLGNLFFDTGNHERAVATYDRYLALHPDDANVWTDMGTQLLQMGRSQEAIDAYQKALSLFPNFYNAFFNMNIAYEHMGDQAKADEYKAKAKKIGEEFGKVMPPIKNLPRLPEGAAASPTAVDTAGTDAAPAAATNDRYAGLEKFFREHAIIGPKIVGFETVGDKAILNVAQFPMDQIPESMRGSLDAKIKDQLASAGSGAMLDIVDSASRRVMSSYQID